MIDSCPAWCLYFCIDFLSTELSDLRIFNSRQCSSGTICSFEADSSHQTAKTRLMRMAMTGGLCFISCLAWWCSIQSFDVRQAPRDCCCLRQVNHFVDEVQWSKQVQRKMNRCEKDAMLFFYSGWVVEGSCHSLCSPFLYHVEKAMSSFVFGVGFRWYVTCACPPSVL